MSAAEPNTDVALCDISWLPAAAAGVIVTMTTHQ